MTIKHEENTDCSEMRSLSQQDAAVLIGRPTIWLRDNAHLAHRNKDGTYDGLALVAGIMERLPVEDLGDGEISRKQKEAELARTVAQADKLKFEIEMGQGNMVQLDEVIASISEVMTLFTERLMGIADKIAPSLTEADARKSVPKIKSVMGEVMLDLSRELEQSRVGMECDA